MKKAIAVLLVGCLLAALPFTVTACKDDGDGTPAEGQLPTLEVGDQWVWSYTMYGTTYTLTEEVIGEEKVEGRDCYVIDMSFDPLLTFAQIGGESTITSMKYWGDKDTGILEVKREMLGDYNEESFTLTMISDYDPWESIFPLEIGREVETEQTITQYYGDTQSGEPTVSVEKFEVNGQEDVIVSAGTFSCWKITIYDGTGDIIQIIWWSDEAKTIVKSTGDDGTVIMELISYSVS
ncbi:MAG: hypothetical protein PVJ08_01870 [Dehalococcoidia bacterium]|jgi:hypothetical protein